MKLRILGSGTSTGVPEVGCRCAVCTSADPRDKRLRASSLVEMEDGTRILIDCGPDFREQLLRCPDFKQLHGVLVTHEHYDHVGGLDDLRPFCQFGEIPVYCDAYCAAHLRERIPYCFAEHPYPGIPRIYLNEVQPLQPFQVRNTEIIPVQVMHGRLPILGYRIGELGYVTDMLTMPETSFETLKGVKVLVINALRTKPHGSHQTIADALAAAGRIGAKETYLIHMSHHAGLHAELEQTLPPQVHLAYDGMTIDTALM